jgi:phospholipase/lecithinase/hemolysin
VKTFVTGLLKGVITRRNMLAALAMGAGLVAGQLPAWANKTPFSEIVVFGDSVSDNGNGLYRLTGGAMPTPPYWEGRFSNGPVWAEYLAAALGMAGLLDDYAVSGATSGTQVNGAPPDWPHGVKSQIEEYLLSHRGDPDALYIIWTGHNDIFIPLFSSPMGDLNAAGVAFVENMKNNIKTLWTAGARHILVVNISDIGKAPGLNSPPELSAFSSSVTASFNAGLAAVLNELAAEGVRTMAMDSFAISDTVVAQPAQFGFVNATDDPFPQNPPGYVYFGGHPSTRYHQVIAQFAVQDLVDYFSPSRGHGMPPAQVNALNGLVQAGKPGKGH